MRESKILPLSQQNNAPLPVIQDSIIVDHLDELNIVPTSLLFHNAHRGFDENIVPFNFNECKITIITGNIPNTNSFKQDLLWDIYNKFSSTINPAGRSNALVIPFEQGTVSSLVGSFNDFYITDAKDLSAKQNFNFTKEERLSFREKNMSRMATIHNNFLLRKTYSSPIEGDNVLNLLSYFVHNITLVTDYTDQFFSTNLLPYVKYVIDINYGGTLGKKINVAHLTTTFYEPNLSGEFIEEETLIGLPSPSQNFY